MTPKRPHYTWGQTLARAFGMNVYNTMSMAWALGFAIWVIHHPNTSNWWLLAYVGGLWLTDRLGRVFLAAARLNKKGEHQVPSLLTEENSK